MENVAKKFTEYAEDVVNGRIVAGELIKLTCKRYLSWFDRDDIYFDEEAAERPVKFIAKLKLWQGKQFKGKPFELQDWQKFMVYGMFGWYRKSTGRRLIRQAYVQIARKCGKTSLTAALGLYGLIADKEPGAEVTTVAPSSKQSQLLFEHARNLGASINKHNILNMNRAGLIKFPYTKSKFHIMSSDKNFGDGFNPSIGIVDEYHAFKDNDVPNLIRDGMMMRTNPLMIYITTAGTNLYGPCKEFRDMCEDILKGLKHDDTIFPLIYELDKTDNWEDETCWKKCCPALHNTVFEDAMSSALTLAKNNPSDEIDIKTKNFNMWCAGETNWINEETVKKYSIDFELEDLMVYDEKLKKKVMPKKYYAFVGIDLAADRDFTSMSICIPAENRQIYFKTYLFVPSQSIKTSPLKYMYQNWDRQKDIIVCDGNVQDYDIILNKLLEINSLIPIYKVGYDPFHSTSFAVNMEYHGFNLEIIKQSAGHYTDPIANLYRKFLLGEVKIDNNAAVRWCFNNVVMHEDNHRNKFPKKKGKRIEKIDAVVSMLMAFTVMSRDKYCKANYIDEEQKK